MKFGKLLTYKDIDEAEKLIGKKVIHSNTLKDLETRPDKWLRPMVLTGVNKGDSCLYPFRLLDGTFVQFIREVIEDEPEKSRYKPYDLSDKKVRDSMRGRWFHDEYGNEIPVDLFSYDKNWNVWHVSTYKAEEFLEKCTWVDDGTPCGRKVENADGEGSER